MLESQPHIVAMKCKNYKKQSPKNYIFYYLILLIYVFWSKKQKNIKKKNFVRYNRGSVRYNQEEILLVWLEPTKQWEMFVITKSSL
jgi:hypothetical protein